MFVDGFQDQQHILRERSKAHELRAGLWWRQRVGPGICHHCNQKFDKRDITMDHVIPISRGGKSTKNNVVPSCKACNTAKGCALPVEKFFK